MGAPIALVDGNNVYATCERVVQPRRRRAKRTRLPQVRLFIFIDLFVGKRIRLAPKSVLSGRRSEVFQ
jgi:hypothetical protein